MQIERLDVLVTDLDEAVGFYRDLLDLKVEEVEDKAIVFIGCSVLRLIPDSASVSRDHLAFLVPANRFEEAKAWLQERTGLLDDDGQVEFRGPHGWNSNSVYFRGPSGALLELIAHFDLANDTPLPFSATDLLAVCEVGIAVPDVRQAAELLRTRADLAAFANPPSKDFAAVGDREGRLILAAVGRPWRPTRDLTARPGRLIIRATGPAPGLYRLAAAELIVEADQSA